MSKTTRLIIQLLFVLINVPGMLNGNPISFLACGFCAAMLFVMAVG